MEEKTREEQEFELNETAGEMELEEALKAVEGETAEEKPAGDELDETKDKYLRLYAEFENYKKRMLKDKEELLKYSNESLLYDLLTSMDNLEIAIKHSGESSSGLVEGVKITLRELMRTLEKYGLRPIDSEGKPFNPEFHHAMSQVERDDMEENTVVEEFRKGYIYGDKVLRASLVSVSKKPSACAAE